jgi:hypothetical protein
MDKVGCRNLPQRRPCCLDERSGMVSALLARHSLKTRITLITLAIFVIGIWSLAFYASRVLHGEMQNLLGDQQFSTVSILAAELNDDL